MTELCQYFSADTLTWVYSNIQLSYFKSRSRTDNIPWVVFSAPETKAQVHYCDHALSVVRPSLTFHIFNFSSETTERNSTKLHRKQDLNVLYQVCVFRVDRKNKMAALASDWLRHFRLLLWNRWTEFNKTWQEARSQRPLPSLCFSGRSKKQDGGPGLWFAETFSTSSLKPLYGIQRNLIGSKISTSSTKFVFLGRSEKQDGRPRLWLAETFLNSPLKPQNGIQWNTTGSKISTSSTKFVFFGPVGKNKMAALAFDLLRHFLLLLWNRRTEFKETWQEVRSQRPLPSLCFSGRSENKMAALTSDWLRHFRLLLWNRWTEFNKTWQEERSQHPLPSLCFSGWSVNKCPPCPIPQKGGTLYSGARYVALWASW